MYFERQNERIGRGYKGILRNGRNDIVKWHTAGERMSMRDLGLATWPVPAVQFHASCTAEQGANVALDCAVSLPLTTLQIGIMTRRNKVAAQRRIECRLRIRCVVRTMLPRRHVRTKPIGCVHVKALEYVCDMLVGGCPLALFQAHKRHKGGECELTV